MLFLQVTSKLQQLSIPKKLDISESTYSTLLAIYKITVALHLHNGRIKGISYQPILPPKYYKQ
jgi:hypothetical protein